ncbi:hypothetical protein SDC9_59500 [bioreactor metagenome]|uniref:Uncharacterized protein n=1 Tax=bioreactor metagenome TaxID=1076179 RepID=A0A644XAA7_9ZZZZ|nr:hypothetical protein [Candidatus Metalachnospira sp.]
MKRERSSISNFKGIKLFAEVLVFVLVLLAVYKYIGTKYAQAESKNVINAYTKSRYDGFYEQPENSIDMVFIGSSHSYCTFDPQNFDSVMGTSSWQMGTPLQHYDTSLYVLKEVLKTQTPKLVVLDLYWDMLDDEFDMKQANSFFQVVKDKNVQEDYVKNVFPLNERVKYKLLPIRYQQDYFAYEADVFQKAAKEKFGVHDKQNVQTNGTEYYLAKGYTYCDTVIPDSELDETNQFKGFDGEKWEADKTQIEYINQIVKLCKENNIELVFETAPIANVSLDYIKNYDAIHEKMADIADSFGIKYLDFNIANRDEGLLELENFRDDAHLNDSGVKIINGYYANWLLNNTESYGNNNL